jgi:hypothetical protein
LLSHCLSIAPSLAQPSLSGKDIITAQASEDGQQADYGEAERAGTVSAWDAFLAHHSDGLLADLARAERDKLVERNRLVKPNTEPTARAAILVAAPEEPDKVKTYVGTVVWHLETVQDNRGKFLGLIVQANVAIPAAKIKVAFSFQKNFDANFSASHTMDSIFTLAPDSPLGSIKEIRTPQMRAADAQNGNSLSGICVPIAENSFLVGLTGGDSEARNQELIEHRGWFDIPMIVQPGERLAKLTLEKGTTGTRVIGEAFTAWQAQSEQ